RGCAGTLFPGCAGTLFGILGSLLGILASLFETVGSLFRTNGSVFGSLGSLCTSINGHLLAASGSLLAVNGPLSECRLSGSVLPGMGWIILRAFVARKKICVPRRCQHPVGQHVGRSARVECDAQNAGNESPHKQYVTPARPKASRRNQIRIALACFQQRS